MSQTGSMDGSRTGAGRGQDDEVLAADRAFAIRMAYDGIRSAFLSVLAQDAVVLGQGPVPGRAHYEALPADDGGRLLWEPVCSATSPDGTLACTAGPYRLLDGAGAERACGVYLSVWRRVQGSGVFELVLDLGAKDAVLPPEGLPFPAPAGAACDLAPHLAEWLRTGQVPPLEGAVVLGGPVDMGDLRPGGDFHSQDGSLGVLWGSRRRDDGSEGAFALLLAAAGCPSPVVVICA
ncbi:MAG TPA: hypothetical protein VN436_00480 [Holophaga sp.]|nr:hypothetical protein [Holophaga sp.]